MSNKLKGKRVAILMTDGFEQSEYTEPRQALENEGAEITVISPTSGKVTAWHTDNWGESYAVDLTLDAVKSADYDALLLPGGVMNPDQLRKNEDVVTLIKEFRTSGKPIAAICHGPQLLIETGDLSEFKLTSYPSVKTDLQNAGATWVDEEVVADNGLVTSRSPADIPAFNAKMIEEFCEGSHQRQRLSA